MADTKFIFAPKDDITTIELIRAMALSIECSSECFQKLIIDKLIAEGIDPETVARHFREHNEMPERANG